MEPSDRSFFSTPAGIAACGFLAVLGLLLWLEHRAHVLGALPLVLPILICVGMHFFMHKGHHDRHRRNGDPDER